MQLSRTIHFQARTPWVSFLVLLSCLVLLSSVACRVYANETSNISIGLEILEQQPRLNEIASLVIQTADLPTEDLHAEFWELMQPYLKGNLADIIGIMESAVTAGLIIEKELWRSLLISAQTRRVFKTDGLKLAQLETDETVLSRRQIEQQNSLLSAAATRSTVNLNGDQIAITPKVARKTLENFKAIEKRLEKLLNPIWVK